MAKLTTAERNALPDSAFAEPAERAYPIKKLDSSGNLVPDPAHAANAKSRAHGTGAKNLSGHMQDVIVTKANKALGNG